jgi:rhodanese-related sulfurtransferase
MTDTLKPVRNLSPDEVAAMMRNGDTTMVDVREDHEAAAERIAGTSLMPLSRFDAGKLPNGKIVFHCGTGKRSLAALESCRAAGLAHDAHLAGGLAAWKQAGLPTLQG